MLGLSIKTESAHVDLYINTCRHWHSLLSTYNTQEGELLRACCSDNCLFGQWETNSAGISLNKVFGVKQPACVSAYLGGSKFINDL